MKRLIVFFSALFLINSFSQTREIIYPKSQENYSPVDSGYSQIIWLGDDYSSFDYEYLFNHWYQSNHDIHLTTREGRPLLFTDINSDSILDMIGNSEAFDSSTVGYAEYDSNAVPIFQFVSNFSMENYWPENIADLNNDGTDEILTGSEFPFLNIFNNNSAFFRTLPVRGSSGFKQILISDLNANYNIDFVTNQFLNGKSSINFYEYDYLSDTLNLVTRIDSIMRRYIVNGDTLDTLVTIGDSFSRFVKGDLDGDGISEVAAGHGEGHICIFEYDGTSYKQVYFDRMPTVNMYQIAIMNDINLNGKNELIVMGNYDGGPIYWLEADGDNNYSIIRQDFIDYGNNISIIYPMTMYAKDVDMDGKQELVFFGGSLIWILKFNPVENNWDMLVYFNMNHDYDAMWGNGHNRSFPGSIANIEFNDIDNDGDNDMFVSTRSEDLTLFFKSTQTVSDVHNQNYNYLNTFKFSQNYPNPFNPTTTFEYYVPRASFVTITLYDILGNKIRTLVNEEMNSGNYTLTVDGSNITSGVYFCTLKSDNFTDTKKITLLK